MCLKRFVAANRERLSVGKDRQLYYRKMPEAAIEEISETTESGESDSARPTGDEDRLQVMRERIASLDEKIAEIDERYDRQLESLSADFNATEQILGEERAKSRELSAQLSSLSSQIDVAARDIELLETRLHKAIDARSPAADALLDYRVPPFTSRSDRMARLCAEREQLRQQLLAARAKAIDEVISHGRRTGLILEIAHQVLEALRLGVCPKPEVHDAKDEDLRP